MTLGTIVYALAIAGLLAAAARVAEAGLAAIGAPRRSVWAVALIASTALPLLAPFRAAPPMPALDVAVRSGGAGAANDLPPAAAPLGLDLGAVTRGLLETPLGNAEGLLFGLSLLAALILLGGALRIARAGRRWPTVRLGGRDVRLTEAFGPALVGLLRPRIALPRTALRLDREHLEMVLRHEDEHRRAGDPWLLWGGAVLLCLQPWNPLLWIQFARLRSAVEVDCDARVLKSGVSAARYGRLLLTLQTAPRSLSTPVPMLGERGHTLERRLMTMKRRFETPRPGRALGLVLVAGALTVVACDAPTPASIDEIEPEMTSSEAEIEVPATFTAVELPVDESEVPIHVAQVVAGKLIERVDGEATFVYEEVPIDSDLHRELDAENLTVDRVFEVRNDREVESATFEARELTEAPPLIVVDGVITSYDLSDIASIEVQSIELVKGQAATDLYGPRGQNGVVHVVTKDSPEGREAARHHAEFREEPVATGALRRRGN